MLICPPLQSAQPDQPPPRHKPLDRPALPDLCSLDIKWTSISSHRGGCLFGLRTAIFV